MTSLEFIEKEIEATKDVIDATLEALSDDVVNEIKVYCYFNKESILNELNYAKGRLKTLQQIKAKLEALEVIKEELQIVDKTTNQYGEPLYRYELNIVGQDKINTLEKEMSKKVEIRQRNSLSEPYFVCPTCNKTLDNDDEYCSYCKQKLDYSSYYGDEDEQ